MTNPCGEIILGTSAGIEPPYQECYIRVLKPRKPINTITITFDLSFAGPSEDEWDCWPLGGEDE